MNVCVSRNLVKFQTSRGVTINFWFPVQNFKDLLGGREGIVDVDQGGEGHPDHGAPIEDHDGDLPDGVRGETLWVVVDQPGPVVVADGVGEHEVAVGEPIDKPSDMGLPFGKFMRFVELDTVFLVQMFLTPGIIFVILVKLLKTTFT